MIDINKYDLERGALKAIDGHKSKPDVKEFIEHFDDDVETLYNSLTDGSYIKRLSYRKLHKVNNDGKKREIDSPDLVTRIYQHTFMLKIMPLYSKIDNMVAYNCKNGCGISAMDKEKSLMHHLKHIYFDLRNYKYCLIIDQRRCYAHISTKVFRKMLKRVISDKSMIDFAINVCMVNGKLPIGTPTSPFVHHIIMLGFDKLLKELSIDSLRFADDIFIPLETKEYANAAKWRIKNYWWYELGIRAKRNRTIIKKLDSECDFCGYVYHRNDIQENHYNKGYVTIRNRTANSAKMVNNNKSWGSYFGLLKNADCYSLMIKIEKNMKLNKLTDKIRINRSLDANNIDLKSIEGKHITVIDYDIRQNKGVDNWIKCLIGIDEVDEDNNNTGHVLAMEFHGNCQGIIQFIRAVEKEYKKEDILPIEDAEIINQCGYIFKNSTNQLKYIS